MKVNLKDVEIEETQFKTTTSAACISSTTIALSDVSGVSIGATVTGAGINPSVASPTVSSRTVNTGAGSITVTAAQTLESGQTLFFSPGVKTFTITGIVEVENMAISDTTLYFDIERFVTAQ